MINAEEANKITLSNQEKYEVKRAKKFKKDIDSIQSLIKTESKKGNYFTRWDNREAVDKDEIKSLLIAEGYEVKEGCLCFYISWGSKEEIAHKRFGHE